MRRVGSAETPLRVLVLIDSLIAGGAELLLSDFAAGAPAVGVVPSVAYLGERDGSPAAARLRERRVEPVRVQMGGLLQPASLARVRQHIRAVSPDVVHTHLGYADMLGGLAARSLGVAAVSTVHVMDWHVQGVRERARRRLIASVRRRCAAAVVTVSEAARRELLAARLDRAAHVVTIHNGVAARPAPGAGARIRAELGIDPDELVLLLLAVIREGKGHDVAADAVARLRERHPRLRLLVAGDGPARAAAERALAPLGESARLLGHRDDVMELLDAADLMVLPSAADAFPTALIEAMAGSVAVVATSVGGIPEIVVDGETGILIGAPPTASALAVALEPLLENAELRRRMGMAGRARYEQEFTVETWARRTRQLYDRVIAGGGP
jgi:glycosyltransferase involved in cell wall biosynthesis